MAHSPQTKAAKREGGGNAYDFNPVFQPIQDFLSSADYTVANLETPLAGAAAGFTGYPQFNAPVELAQALFNAGVDLVTTANNHALDRGERGIINTLDALDNIRLAHIGTARTPEEAGKMNIKDLNGIPVGFLSYTYGTNGIPVPKGKPYMVNLIDEKIIVEQIASMRQSGAQAVVVALHFGLEYQRTPSKEQQRLARLLIAQGADVIVGSHAHVQQPMEWVEVDTEEGQRRGLILYSLGNFLSNQRDKYTDTGMIVNITLVRKNSASSPVSIEQATYLPTWVWRKGSPGGFSYRIVAANSSAVPVTTTGLEMPKQDINRKQQAFQELTTLIPGSGSAEPWIVVQSPTVQISKKSIAQSK